MAHPIIIPADPPERQAALLALVENSALAGCTTTKPVGYGAIEVARNWPSLSSGEEVLWRLLASLVDGDLAAALARLDDVNLSALVIAFEALAAPIIVRATEARAALGGVARVCSCGAPDTSSLNPAEVVVHRSEGPCYVATAGGVA